MEQRFYICRHCGNIIAKVKDSGVSVMCCGEKMSEIIPGTTDAAPRSTPCCPSTTSSGCPSTPSRAISARSCIRARSRRSASRFARAMRSRRSMPTATSTACGRREKLKQSSDARKSVGVFCAHFSLHRALLQAQGEGIGEHGDELGIRRFALDV